MKKLFVLLVILNCACSVRVHNSYDHRVDFSKYKTFCWMKGCEFTYTGPGYLNKEEVKEYIQQAIIKEMKERGLELNSDQPDLLLDVHVTMTDETILNYHRKQSDELYYKFYEEPTEISLLRGTLVIDMADQKESRMVWRSVAVSYLDIHPEITSENIQRGIHLVLRKFPPRQKASEPAH